jgi:hypothetical protein
MSARRLRRPRRSRIWAQFADGIDEIFELRPRSAASRALEPVLIEDGSEAGIPALILP